MKNSWACDNCVHKEVCAHRSTLIALQNELYRGLEHTYFKGTGEYDRTFKLVDYDFIKTIKIECKHHACGTSILLED